MNIKRIIMALAGTAAALTMAATVAPSAMAAAHSPSCPETAVVTHTCVTS